MSYSFKMLTIYYIHEEGKNQNIPFKYVHSEVSSYQNTGKVILKGCVFYTSLETARNIVNLGHTVDNENYINN